MKCRICSNIEGLVGYSFEEKMHGLGKSFDYFECTKCGCLQIKDIPDNIADYYPEGYYSYGHPKLGFWAQIKQLVLFYRDYYELWNAGSFGKLLSYISPNQLLSILRKAGLTKDTKVLDVGSGSGELLHCLRRLGIKQLVGVDPFLDKCICHDGVRLLKANFEDVGGLWDLIMFNHSFEHIFDQYATLKHVQRTLSSGGLCLIRVPTVSSYAWHHYGANWVQLDAPRHFFLHSINSMRILAHNSGLEVEGIIYDSSEFQFWGSEQYLRGISLISPVSYSKDPCRSIFSWKRIMKYKRLANDLNQKRQGDQVAFLLKKAY